MKVVEILGSLMENPTPAKHVIASLGTPKSGKEPKETDERRELVIIEGCPIGKVKKT